MATLFRLISGFFKAIWSALSFFRALVFNLLFLALLAVLAFSFFDTGKPGISDNTILKLSIAGDIVEQRSQSELLGDYAGRLLGLYEEPGETVLQDILDAIAQAQDDPRISAVLLDLKNMGAAELNQLAAIGSALEAFRKSGKPIVSAEDYLSQTQYYLASHADTLFLNPMGGVNLHGFGLYRFYVKDALEKLKYDLYYIKNQTLMLDIMIVLQTVEVVLWGKGAR